MPVAQHIQACLRDAFAQTIAMGEPWDNLEQLEVVQLDGFTPSIPAEPGREQELASRF